MTKLSHTQFLQTLPELVIPCLPEPLRGIKVHQPWRWLIQFHFGETVKRCTKPANITLAVGAITDLSRSKTNRLVENAILRQQLFVLKRSVKRPNFTPGDRTRLTQS